MATRASKRRRVDRKSLDFKLLPKFAGNPEDPATAEDKRKWTGWSEIESDPAFFNIMLHQFGVKGVKVQEIISLDIEMLSFLPRPVYGLIFLYRWREDNPVEQDPAPSQNVWFANQTVKNACATIALLNIVNNIPSIDLGEHLRQFKAFTDDFSPPLRGDSIGNFQFVKQIHNSFARKMDMLNSDLTLKNEATCKTSRSKGSKKEDDPETSFHFIAFMPIVGILWKMDGLERQPCSLGPVTTDDWLGQVTPELEARMEGQIEFTILGLVKNPLPGLISLQSQNVEELSAVSKRLDDIHFSHTGTQTTREIWLTGVYLLSCFS